MAIDLFLKIEGITGESQDARHRGAIELQSFSFGEQESGHAGGGGGAGKVSFQDFQFTAKVNKASPHLFLACASGRHFPKATLIARKAGGHGLEFLTLTFQDVVVSSFHDAGAAASTDAPVDQVSLNFGKVTFEFVPQKADGSGDAAVSVAWDVVHNRSL